MYLRNSLVMIEGYPRQNITIEQTGEREFTAVCNEIKHLAVVSSTFSGAQLRIIDAIKEYLDDEPTEVFIKGDKEEYTREEVEEWYTGMSAIDKLERIYENSI